MKYNKYKYLVAAFCAANATMAMAQEPAAADSLKAQKVQMAFREIDASDALLGVTSVDYQEILEKDYMTYPLGDLDAFVPGGTSTWGGSYLVIIDGVPGRPINNIKPDEIETVSFMKGANAVALYGSHAAKGVLLVTTKKGEKADGIRIKARANTGFYVFKSYPKYLGSAEYMVLYNEAYKNDGLEATNGAPYYSDEEIYNYASGSNPYRYPNVDFYTDEYIKKAYNRSDVTAEIDGGTDRATYYTNISFYNIGSPFKVGQAAKGYTNRFSVRGNVNVNITDIISSHVNISYTSYNARGYVGSSYWGEAATWRPNRIAPFIPIDYIDKNASDALTQVNASANIVNGMFPAGTQNDDTNVFADLYFAGKATSTYRKFQFDTGLDIDLSPLTEGLSFHTMFGMDFAGDYSQSYTNTYRTFTPQWANYNGGDVIGGVTATATKDSHSGNLNFSPNSSSSTYAFDARFNYDRTFDEHSIGAIALLRGFQIRQTGQYHNESDASVGFNVHYDYAKRFYLDASASVVHTAKLAEGHRNAFSPSVTLGWNLAKESFLESTPVNKLMLSVCASNVANDVDIESYNMFTGTYSETGAWWAWTDQSQQSTVSKRGANPDLDFVRNKEIAVGIDASLFDNMITAKVSAYRNSQEGLIITSGTSMPEYMSSYYPESSFIPYINYNNNLRMGVEFALGFNKKFGEVELDAIVTGLVNTNEASKRDDSAVEYDYQKSQGKYIDGYWGYECLGFFQSDEEAAKADQSYFGQKEVKAGDLKYKDQNGDGKIDNLDRVELGRYGNPFQYGLGITAKYQGFTLFLAGYGYAGGLSDKTSSYYWMAADSKYSIMARERWTPQTKDSATLPRLSTYAAPNNQQSSDFWTYKKNAFILDKVQLTYDLPSHIFSNMKVLKQAQVYVSGQDLLRFSKEREYEELSIGGEPQSRFYNLGVKVTF